MAWPLHVASSQDEAGSQGVVWIQHKPVLAGSVSHALDLWDNCRDSGYLGTLDCSCRELRTDHGTVQQLLARSQSPLVDELRDARGRSRPARRPVDLPVGKDGDVALVETTRLLADVGVEDRSIQL